MENFYNNPAEEIAEPVVAQEATVVEETPVVEEAPVVEAVEPVKEEPKASEPEAIIAPSYESVPEEQALGAVANGVIGASTTPKTPKKKPAPKVDKEPKTVAIKSTKNVSWVGVGKVSKGINIVSQSEADQWATRDHITIVSPEEVKSEFGN
jgi:hypothetical protein